MVSPTVSKSEDVEVKIAGSSTFGIYPKISLEKSFNFFISESWLVNYAGFQKVVDIEPTAKGRGLFNSIRGGFLIVVVGNFVFKLNNSLGYQKIGTLNPGVSEVDIDENLQGQICIVDGNFAYIYNYITAPNGPLTVQNLTYAGNPIKPSSVCYHNTFFLFGSSPSSVNSAFWYVYQYNVADPTGTTISFVTQLSLQTKPDVALLVDRLPGKGNNVLVLGSTVGEVWTQVGGTENYRRVQSFNIDYGLVTPSSFASSEEIVCWLAQNENNSTVIMVTDGSSIKRISTDGIDNLLETIQFPAQSTAFFWRQNGHLFYQITFFNAADNLTLIHDFNESKFYHITDENLNYHPARQVSFFNGNIYFSSLNDGALYQMSSEILSYNYTIGNPSAALEIPRIRITNTVRKKNADRFRIGQFTFTIEQGVNSYNIGNPIIPTVNLSISKNGNQSFGNVVSKQLNPSGKYKNQLRYWRMGQANELTFQLRFNGFQRFVCTDGIASIF